MGIVSRLLRLVHRSPSVIRVDVLSRPASTHVSVPHGTEAVSFRVTADQAARSFAEHASNTSPLPARIVSVTPLFVPFWLFISNKEAVSAIYAGRRIPRSIAHSIIRSPELASAATNFSVSMLDDTGGERATLEPFSMFEKSAWNLASAPSQITQNGAPRESRRVLSPAYIVEFVSLGVIPQTAYVSGITSACWSAAEAVPGAAAFAAIATRVRSADVTARRVAETLARLHLPPDAWRALALVFAVISRTLSRVIFFPPVALALATLAATVVVAPAAKQRQVLRDWEAQVAAELHAQTGQSDEWVWRALARAARRDPAQTAARGGARAADAESARRRNCIPPVNENDFFAVLGVARGANTADIQAAFRREMLIYHPDHALANGFNEKEAGERTRIILRAYRELRSKHK